MAALPKAESPASRAEAPANRPLHIDDGDSAWIVESGNLDVFFVQTTNGAASGPRRHVMRIHPGQPVFGIPLDHSEASTGLLAVGSPGSSLLKVSLPHLREL